MFRKKLPYFFHSNNTRKCSITEKPIKPFGLSPAIACSGKKLIFQNEQKTIDNTHTSLPLKENRYLV